MYFHETVVANGSLYFIMAVSFESNRMSGDTRTGRNAILVTAG